MALLPLISALAILPQASSIAIKAGFVAMPDQGKTLSNQVILIEEGKIKAIGAGLAIPSGAQVFDLSGYTISPGLFDCHTHLCMNVQPRRDAGNYFYTTLRDSNARRAVQGIANAQAMLNAGFTTCRDVGNEGNYACTETRWAIEQGMFMGPTILNAGRMIAPYGAQYRLQPDRPELGEPEYIFADSRDEMQKGIRMNAHFGAKVIKIVVDDQPYIYSVDDIKFIVEEARRCGLKVCAHCWTEQGALNASEGGVASIEHGFNMSDKALEVAKRYGTYIVGTEFPAEQEMALGRTKARADADHEKWVDRLRRSHKMGNKIAFGTDATAILPGSDRGKDAISWIDSWVDAGIPAADTLRAMTSSAADLLGVDKERGTISVGLAADLIATKGNPMADIKALKAVSFVMKNGKVFRSDVK